MEKKNKNAWNKYDKKGIDEIFKFNEGYKKFIPSLS